MRRPLTRLRQLPRHLRLKKTLGPSVHHCASLAARCPRCPLPTTVPYRCPGALSAPQGRGVGVAVSLRPTNTAPIQPTSAHDAPLRPRYQTQPSIMRGGLQSISSVPPANKPGLRRGWVPRRLWLYSTGLEMALNTTTCQWLMTM